ncbi:MAG: hypothetical protein LAO23_13220 [Acidobacteriia bacterium]|nr:hypothetical protein [Terriglobia bacterium]
MSWERTVLSSLLAGTILSAALAGGAAAQVPIRTGPPIGVRPRPPRQEPCWAVAGVSKSAIEQRRTINQQAHQEVEAVCANSSLSIQQKRQQIRQIRQRERQEIDAIITPAQREAMRACQEQRGHGGGGHVGGGHGGGPCGEMPVPQKPNPQQPNSQKPDPEAENEAPPN